MKLNPNIPFRPKSWPFFYGYFIVVCGIIGFAVSAPGQTIGVSVFTDYLIDSIGITRFQLSVAYMLGTIGSSLIIRQAGRMLDVIGVRIVTMSASVLLGGVLLYMSQVDRLILRWGTMLSEPLFLVMATAATTGGFLLLRFTGQGVLALASRTMLMRWFMDLRGRMNSIMGVFISLTFSASPLLFEGLINNFTWRGAWILLGIAIGIGFTLFSFIFFRDNPEESGLLPDGHRHTQSTQNPIEAEENWTLQDTRRTRTFWIFNLGVSMFSLFITAFTFHVVSIFETAGLQRTDAISLFLPSSIIAVTLNLLAGWLADSKWLKYRLKYLLMAMLVGLALIGVGMFLLRSGVGRYVIILGNGMTSGFFGTVSTVVWPRYFGRLHLGEIAGYNMSFLVFFSAIGPSLFGWSFDGTGSYSIAVMVCSLLMGLLILAALGADKPQRTEAHP